MDSLCADIQALYPDVYILISSQNTNLVPLRIENVFLKTQYWNKTGKTIGARKCNILKVQSEDIYVTALPTTTLNWMNWLAILHCSFRVCLLISFITVEDFGKYAVNPNQYSLIDERVPSPSFSVFERKFSCHFLT